MNAYAPCNASQPHRLATGAGFGFARVRQSLSGVAARHVAWPAKSFGGHVCLFEEFVSTAGRSLAENTLHLALNNASDSARQPHLASFAGGLAERANEFKPCRAVRRPGTNSDCAVAIEVVRNDAVLAGAAKETNCHAGF